MRRRGRVAIAGLVVGLAVVVAPFIRVHGWDWTAGTNSSYCGFFLPHLDLYCESAH